ncbi:MAG: hypothetical protein EBU83_02060 [bacterium]|nr:hypothetical protein [Candidatus Aquidulcis sp.]
MQDDYTPVRYDIHHSSGEATLNHHPEGRFVCYTDFLVAKQSREHWKGKVARWEGEAKSQENVIQNLERLLNDAYKDTDKARTEIGRLNLEVQRLTSIIDHNTSDEGRNLKQVTEENIRLRQMLADIKAIASR